MLISLLNAGTWTSSKSWASTPQTDESQINLTPEDIQAIKDMLTACDKAASDCQKANEDKAKVVEEQKAIIEAQANQIGKFKADQDNVLKSPWFWGPIGLVLGVVLGVVIAK